MSSLAELPEVVGFFSYSREDDEDFGGMLSGLRDAIQRELRAQLGRSKTTFRLWQDKEAIAPGTLWETEIRNAAAQAVFFIPIVTPRMVNSKYCQFEFDTFLARERALGRSDLIFPILYVPVQGLQNEGQWRNNAVLSFVAERQYVDWQKFRYSDFSNPNLREAVGSFARGIVETLYKPLPEQRNAQPKEILLSKDDDKPQVDQDAPAGRPLSEKETLSKIPQRIGTAPKLATTEVSRQSHQGNSEKLQPLGTSELPKPIRTISQLLVGLSILRLFISIVSLAVYPVGFNGFAGLSVIISLAGLAVGISTLQGFRYARGFILGLFAVGAPYYLFILVEGIYHYSLITASIPLATSLIVLLSSIISLASVCLYLVGIVVVRRWRPSGQ
jgi:TIR domain